MYVYLSWYLLFFFFNDTATTEIYTLSLHDALPISANVTPAASRYFRTAAGSAWPAASLDPRQARPKRDPSWPRARRRSEEHTSELQSPDHPLSPLLP